MSTFLRGRIEIRKAKTMVDLLNEKEVAMRWSMSLASLRRWRTNGCGPRYVKLGASVRYRIEDLESWLGTRPSGGEVGEGKDDAERAA
jgi:predicted DNA-binding transcriptional regulator AlpA